MFRRIDEIKELRDLQIELEIANMMPNELATKKEELIRLSKTPKFKGIHDIFYAIEEVNSEMQKNIDKIKYYNRCVDDFIKKLKFDKDFFEEIRYCKKLSNETQYRICRELIKTFELYGYQYDIQRKLVSKKLKNVSFIDILNVIIEA